MKPSEIVEQLREFNRFDVVTDCELKLFKQAANLIESLIPKPINEAPSALDVIIYSPDDGIFMARYTHLADWILHPDTKEMDEAIEAGLTEEDLWQSDWWLFGKEGASRASDYGINPTHFIPLSSIQKLMEGGE